MLALLSSNLQKFVQLQVGKNIGQCNSISVILLSSEVALNM